MKLSFIFHKSLPPWYRSYLMTTPLGCKDAADPRFGHSDIVFLSISSNKHQKVPPANNQQKSLTNQTLEIKSNCFGPVIPKKVKKF